MLAITHEQVDSYYAIALTDELETYLKALYPNSDFRNYQDDVRKESFSFFVLYQNDIPIGCAGVMAYDTYYEVKRVYVRPAFSGNGYSKLLINHLISYVKSHGCSTLRLHTGIRQEKAINLYERMGFYLIPPFGEYSAEDDLSVYYEKIL